MEMIGKKIGQYQIVEEIGRGGMAVIYRAIDVAVQREVALKILHSQYATDETFLRRFIRESRNIEFLKHENIVQIYTTGQKDGYSFIAMELIEGGTLADYLEKQNELLSMGEIIDILSQIASALDYAHSLGFVHRDVKPGNVLMANDGRVLLSDFGAAKHMYMDNTMLTGVGNGIGTPAYMSPEQAKAQSDIDYRSDVYSLGVLAYKLFTGRLPFIADNQAEMLQKLVFEEAVSPKVYNPDLPLGIVRVLERVLKKEPSERYESAGAFVASLLAGQRWAPFAQTPYVENSSNMATVATSVMKGVQTSVFSIPKMIARVELDKIVQPVTEYYRAFLADAQAELDESPNGEIVKRALSVFRTLLRHIWHLLLVLLPYIRRSSFYLYRRVMTARLFPRLKSTIGALVLAANRWFHKRKHPVIRQDTTPLSHSFIEQYASPTAPTRKSRRLMRKTLKLGFASILFLMGLSLWNQDAFQNGVVAASEQGDRLYLDRISSLIAPVTESSYYQTYITPYAAAYSAQWSTSIEEYTQSEIGEIVQQPKEWILGALDVTVDMMIEVSQGNFGVVSTGEIESWISAWTGTPEDMPIVTGPTPPLQLKPNLAVPRTYAQSK